MSPSVVDGAVPGERVWWTGRLADVLPAGIEGLDGWATDDAALARRLAGAAELVVLDPLSFPWGVMDDALRALPVVAVLPDDVEGPDLVELLGRVLLRHLTPFDRLVEARPEVRALVEATYGVHPEVWLDADPAAPASADAPGWVAPLAAHLRDGLVAVTGDVGDFLAPRGDLVTRHLVEHGAHQRATLNAVLSLVRPGDFVVDVGAHIGTFSVPMAARVGAEGALLAVEGSPTTASVLTHNLRAHAVPGPGPRRAILATDEHWRVAVPAEGNTGANRFDRSEEGAVGAAATTSLDRLLDEVAPGRLPAVLKIDVEGAELDVLRGAERMIAAARPLLCLEVSDSQLGEAGQEVGGLQAWLDEHDYTTYVVLGERNGRQATWSLEPLARLADHDEALFDVVAAPREGDLAERVETGGSLAPVAPAPVVARAETADDLVLPRAEPDGVALLLKRRLRQAARAVADDLTAWARRSAQETLVVDAFGAARGLRTTLTTMTGFRVRDGERTDAGVELVVPAPEAAVAWFGGDALDPATRRELMVAGIGRLHPGGRLVLLADVVDEPGEQVHPRVSELVEQVHLVTRSAVHVDELRSLRWYGERRTRGVLMGMTSLLPVAQ